MAITLNISDNFTGLVTKFNQLSNGVGDTTALNIEGESDIANILTAIYSLIDSDTDFTGKISATDTGGDGSLTYNQSTGVITYTGPSPSEVRAHFTAGDAIDSASLTSGIVAVEDDGIDRTKLKDEVTLIIKDSSGTALKTLYGAGS